VDRRRVCTGGGFFVHVFVVVEVIAVEHLTPSIETA